MAVSDYNGKYKRVLWIALSILVLFFYTLFLVFSGNGTNRHSYNLTGYLPEINREYTHEQEIYCNRDNLCSVSVEFLTFVRANEGDICFELFDEDGSLIVSRTLDVSTIPDKYIYTLELDEPIEDSSEKTYTLRISSDSKAGKGVTLGTTYDELCYNLTFDDSSLLLTILKFCPFIFVPFVFFKMRGNTWGTAYALYCVFIIAIHLYVPTFTNDDAFFSRANDGFTALSWVISRWNSWSSRFIQEFAMYYAVDRPMLWLFADTAMASLLPIFINKSVGATGLSRLYSLMAIPLYSILDMRSAGWIVTTITYFWAVFPAFVVASILRKFMDQKKLAWYDYPVFFFCLIWASNHELMAVYLLCIIMYCAVMAYIKKSSSMRFLIIAAVVSIINLGVMMILCPGIRNRGESEISNFPGYGDLNVIDKLFIGINRCLTITITRRDSVFVVLCIMIAVAVFIRTKDVKKRIIAFLPAVLLFAINQLTSFIITDNIIWVRLKSFFTLGITLFAFALLFCLVYSIFVIYQDKDKESIFSSYGVFINTVLLAGLATTVAMAFSPTVYVSEYRTSCFTYFGMIYIILDIAIRLTKDHKPSPKTVYPFVIACEILFLLGRLLTVMGVTFISYE